MARPPVTAQRRSQTRSERARAEQSDATAVCLVGYPGPVARYAGDNRGAWPVRVVIAQDPRHAADKDDLAQPIHQMVVLEYVMVPTKEHASRLKAALDRAILGDLERHGSGQLRRSWRDMVDIWDDGMREVWWGVVLESAWREVKRGVRVHGAMERHTQTKGAA